VDDLAGRIQSAILTGQFPLGSKLRQESLAEQFGVSRTPIREALRQLQAAGVVEVSPHRGAVVRGPSPRDVSEAYEVRAELESLAADLSARLISDSQMDQLRGAEALFRRAVVREEHATAAGNGVTSILDAQWPRANDLFHEVILEASGNRRLQETVAQLHLSIPRNLTWGALHGNSRLLEQNVDEHAAVLTAIEERRPAAARAAMKSHVLRSGRLVQRRLEEAQASAKRT
jgi:DNA-binding GntR family transcriptional regulator